MVNVFYNLVEKYNKQIEYQDLVINKQELWELTGFKGKYKSEYIRELIKELTRSSTYNVTEKHKINGSMFVTEDLGDSIKIEVPRTFQKYLFYKKDIDLMTRAKKKEKMSIADLDYWDREGKEKSKFLVLLKKADILGISGKYNKRLYALLSQFNKTRKYIARWNQFKEILEIPVSYQTSDIDKQILKKAKKELLKVGLKITKINKIKKGRSIDRIEIMFKIENDVQTQPKYLQGVDTSVEDGEEFRNKRREPKSKELKEFINKVDILGKKKIKGSRHILFKALLMGCYDFEAVNKLILEYELDETN